MNRILVLVIMILVPVTFVVKNQEEGVMVGYSEMVKNISLEIPIQNSQNNQDNQDSKEGIINTQVLVSRNENKSDAFYVDLEEYVIGVVAGEMPASFGMEALRAQAVAARTYAYYKMKNLNDYVLSTTINDQVYLTLAQMQNKWGSDYEHYYARVKEAVDSTRGQILTYNNEVIISYYFAISNGYTDDGKVVFNEDKEYLSSVESNWDKNYQAYTSVRKISRNSFCNNLGITCNDIVIGDIVRASNNYVREITINGVSFTGIDIFNKLSLRSTDFDIDVNNDDITITTRGYGHGVGMSQYGAEGMASLGYNYQDILKYYYQKTEIASIN